MVDDFPSCSANAADDACVSCAKASCCGEYQACSSDATCLCWVGCKYGGNSDAICAQPANCGALDAVTSAAASCLDANCPSECATMATMAGACNCGTSGTSSSSSSGGTTGPSCTPGSFGSGEACSSNADCSSCVCSPQTMTCD
jgi:hypothetical protein